MTEPPHALQDKLDTIVNLLQERSFYSLDGTDKETLLTEAQGLSERLVSAQGIPLTIGLIGGTGVGKSTLMNALAGAPIASTSYRRPHTDRILIYKHEDAKGISKERLQSVPSREITHRCDSIQQFLLCDLPDFDSLLGEHRQNVLRFLKHLDILVWVTSPEKYADRRFHEFLATVPKAQQNFYFVLNKADLLFEGKSLETGYEQLDSVTRRFVELLKEKMDPAAIIFYPLAAREAQEGENLSAWNQFPSFRQQVFQQRDIKQIAAIKAANVDVEIDRLSSSLQKEVSTLKNLSTVLETLTADLEDRRETWRQGAVKPIDLWVDTYLKKEVLSLQADPTCLIGPGYPIATLLSRRGENRPEPAPGLLAGQFQPPDSVMDLFQDHQRLILDRIHHLMLRHRLPDTLRTEINDFIDTKRQMAGLKTRLSDHVTVLIGRHAPRSCRGFKLVQSLTYLLLFGFFLFAVGGRPSWTAFLDAPGISSAIRLILTIITSLFGAKGLAALGSFVLLNLFLGFRFYRAYQNRLERRARKMVGGLKTGLLKVWEDELDQILERIRTFRSEIDAETETLTEVTDNRNV